MNTGDIEKGVYLLFKDQFNVMHVGMVTSIVKDEIGVLVVKSIEESNLNTAIIPVGSIEMVFNTDINLDTLEEDYPEIWI